MKILTISNYFPEHIGGIEIVASNLVSRWRKTHLVRWVACTTKDNKHVGNSDDIALAASNFTEKKLGFPYPIPYFKGVWKIYHEVKQCDVVHFHDCLYLANVFAFVFSRLLGKPVFVTQHVEIVPYAQRYKLLLQKLAYRIIGIPILERAEQVVFISQRVKKFFESQTKFKRLAKFIPNGVDKSIFYPVTEQERTLLRSEEGYSPTDIVILYVGRFTDKKGILLIRDCAANLPNLRWILIGQGELSPQRWGLPNIQVLPAQPQHILQKFYNLADLLVLPSTGEGFPLVVQEAMACGLPVIISKELANQISETPVISTELSSRSIEKTLSRYVTHRDKLIALRKEVLQFSQIWDWDLISDQYLHIFRQFGQVNGN